MRRVIYYVTMSLDGYIADSDGGVGWLRGEPGTDYGYAEFYGRTDCVLLGSSTYEQVTGFDVPFPYTDKPVYVFTSRSDLPVAGPNVEFISESPEPFVARLKISEGKAIWLGGGGALAATLLDAGLLDELDVFVQPIILGAGIPLFRGPHLRSLQLIGSKPWLGGLVEMRFNVIKPRRKDEELGL